MSDKTTETPAAEEQAAARDATNWAKSVSRLTVSEVPEGAVNINVEGLRLAWPIQGFGKMWQVWHGSAIRSTLYMLGGPGRALKRLFKRDRAVG